MTSHPVIDRIRSVRHEWLGAVWALALAPCVAHADVQLYGRLNLSIEHRACAACVPIEVADNASRIGLLETEQVTPSIRAGVHLEKGFDGTTGQSYGQGFDRGAELFIGTDNVKLSAGRFGSTAYLGVTDVVSLHNHDTGISGDALFAHVEPLERKVGVTVTAGPWTGQMVAWQPDPLSDAKGGKAVFVAYASSNVSSAVSIGWDDRRYEHSARVIWQGSTVQLAAYVQRDRDVYGEGLRNLARVAIAWNVGRSELHVNVARAGAYSTGREGQGGARQWTIGYNFNLSQRTKVYVLTTAVLDDGRLYGTRRAQAVGLRHNF